MKRHILFRSALLTCMVGLFVGLVACGSGGEVKNPPANQNGLCGAGCPTGQFCFNGLCVVGCNSDGDCASNQYCNTDEKQCANKTVPSCPSTPCGDNQECVNGLCSAKTKTQPAKKDAPGACSITVDSSDGCGKYELCIEPESGFRQCRAFPPCGQDGSCPVGMVGSVCNDGYLPSKGKICLVGACREDKHCPGSFKCVRLNGTSLGLCSDGSFGQLCDKDEHCQDGLTCNKAAAGFNGQCFSTEPPGGIPGLP